MCRCHQWESVQTDFSSAHGAEAQAQIANPVFFVMAMERLAEVSTSTTFAVDPVFDRVSFRSVSYYSLQSN